MTVENQFNITESLIAETSMRIRSSSPIQVYGRGEFRNLIFEELVAKLGLPWRETDCGQLPDWDDPRVKQLSREFDACYKEQEQYETIEGINARCDMADSRSLGCDWETTSTAKVELPDRILVESPLTRACRKHHDNYHGLHNRFNLTRDGEDIGVASVSSEVCTGWIKEIPTR